VADRRVLRSHDDRQDVHTGEVSIEFAEVCRELIRTVGIQPDDMGPRPIDVADGASEFSLFDAGIVVDDDVAAGRVTESAEPEHQRSGSGD
jgi:hypothetical protein